VMADRNWRSPAIHSDVATGGRVDTRISFELASAARAWRGRLARAAARAATVCPAARFREHFWIVGQGRAGSAVQQRKTCQDRCRRPRPIARPLHCLCHPLGPEPNTPRAARVRTRRCVAGSRAPQSSPGCFSCLRVRRRRKANGPDAFRRRGRATQRRIAAL